MIGRTNREHLWLWPEEAQKYLHTAPSSKSLETTVVEDDSQTIDTQSDGQQILNRILTYDFMTLIGFWKRLLISIEKVQKRLQDKTMNFHNAGLDLKDLIDNFNDKRERIIDECLENGKILCDKWGLNLKEGRDAKK